MHAKAVAECRATLTYALRASRNAISEDPTASGFLELLDRVEIDDGAPPTRAMRVVLMGRTMAGKSTLLAALTGGSAERIGVGAQRTSRNVFGAPAADLDEVEIVDTPGVGAKDGAEDAATAMAEVPGADLVLWVASNDSFQEETAKALQAVAFRGKPVVIALNCRVPLVDDLDRDDFLENPGAVFDQHEGHFETIRNYLSVAGIRPIAEVTLHAEAARQARTDVGYAAELRKASRLDGLVDVLKVESRDRRVARRVLCAADEVRAQADTLRDAICDVEAGVRETVRVCIGMRQDQERRTARLIDGCQQELEDEVVRLVGQRRDWHQTVTDFGPDVAQKWDGEQSRLLVDIDDAIKDRLTSLARDIDEASEAATHEWSTAIRPRLQIEGLLDFRGLWKRKAIGIAVGGGGAFAVAVIGGALTGGPLGVAIGLVVTSLGASAISVLRKKAQGLFKSKTRILEENRELLGSEISKALDGLERRAHAEVSSVISGIREEVSNTFEQRAEATGTALMVANVLASQHRVIDAATADLDYQTVRCLLQADGRPRLAASVEKVTRLPGVCAIIQVSDHPLTEAWLFPPRSPELLAFGSSPTPRLPGVQAGSYVLGLTDEIPTAIHCRSDATVIVANTAAPATVLAAWSAAVSEHLGTEVEIVQSSPTGSAA